MTEAMMVAGGIPPGGMAPHPGYAQGSGSPGGFGGPPGGPYPYPYFPPPPQSAGPTGASIVALIFGLLGMMTTCFPMGLIALGLGFRARKAARERGEQSGSPDNTLALIGMILGGIFGTLWALYWLFYVFAFALGFGSIFLSILLG